MKFEMAHESDFETPKLFESPKSILYFSKKSPFKDSTSEDAVAIFEFDSGYVLAVADGAGGHPKGEEAARQVMENLKKHLGQTKNKAGQLRSPIVDAIEETNRYLIDTGVGSRTTVTVCEISTTMARVYQVGDSACLICGQKGKLKYRSTSHSPVGYQLEAGLIDEQEAIEHPDLHYISNLVGDPEMKIEIGPEVELASNDTIFLASDGITDNFPPNELVEVVRKGGAESISEELMILINERIYGREESKKDDISFVVFKN